MRSLSLLVLLCVLGGCPLLSATLTRSPAGSGSNISSPYPHASSPPRSLVVYSGDGLAPGDKVTLETLGGGLARQQPQLYRLTSAAGWLNGTTPGSTGDAYTLWLNELKEYFGVNVDAQFLNDPPTKLLAHCKPLDPAAPLHSVSTPPVLQSHPPVYCS